MQLMTAVAGLAKLNAKYPQARYFRKPQNVTLDLGWSLTANGGKSRKNPTLTVTDAAILIAV